MNEIWKWVVGYEDVYQISNQGRVRSVDRVTRGRRRESQILKPILRKGYPSVNLCKAGTRLACEIHSLVLEAFVGSRPKGHEACHFPDQNRANCRLDNLRWDTVKNNQADRIAHGTSQHGERNPRAKLRDIEVLFIRNSASTLSTSILSERFGIAPSTIRNIIQRRVWRHI